ncbi:MAG TPA: hypothetical protein VFZ68_04790 [Acidimicrobiales bacterium]
MKRLRPLRVLGLPPWRRAPARSLSIPSLFLGVVVAAFVLGVAGGSRPMLQSSAATASLHQDLEEGCRYDVGLRVSRQVAVDPRPDRGDGPPDLRAATRALDDAIGEPGGLGPTVTTLSMSRAEVRSLDGSRHLTVQLMARTDATDHVEVLERGSGTGIWLPDVVAESVGVGAGDEVALRVGDLGGTTTQVPVGAVFRDLRAGRDRSWCSLTQAFVGPAALNPPPPLVLIDHDLMIRALADQRVGRVLTIWEYPPATSGWDLPRARSTIGRLEEVADRAESRADPLGELLGSGYSSADRLESTRHAERTAATVESVSGPVALGTVGVAIVMLLASARSWLTRRSQEVTVLAQRGAGPAALGAKAVLEMLPALAIGAAAGVAVAAGVVRALGPGAAMERQAIVSGAVFVGLAVAAALVAVALVVGAGVRRVGTGTGGASVRPSLLWWEPPVLALAGAALYELRTRESPVVDETGVDGLLLLFPILLLAGGAGLLGRAVLARRPLGWVAARLPTPGWLAARRLASARVGAALLMTGAAVSIGIVVFAGALSGSLRATSRAKAMLGPGAEQVIRVNDPVPVAELGRFRELSTQVTRTTEASVLRQGHTRADVLGVDPETFDQGAFWDASFARRSLGELLALLEPTSAGGAAPAIAVGAGLQDDMVLLLPGREGNVELEVEVVDRAGAFPGYGFRHRRPLVVVNRAELTRRGVLEPVEVWIDDPSPAAGEAVSATGVEVLFAIVPESNIERSLLQPLTWAIDHFEIIGLAAALVTVAGLGPYFAAQGARQLGTTVARRLGMSPFQAGAATILEVLVILAAGFVFGAGLALMAVRLVFGNLDPLPNTPPDPILVVNRWILVLCAVGVVAVSALVSGIVERRASRASLPELLRHAR